MRPTLEPLTLAFGGGGAKCAAHAGVLAVLEEAGLPIGPVAGTSGGGLVALLYGAGYSPQRIRDYFAETELSEMWEPDPARKAIFGASRIRARFEQMVGGMTFADLKRPAVAMAMNFRTAQPVRLESGSLVDALTATMAMPGIFSGVERDGQLLMDAGPINPIPVDVARELGSRVVGIDVLHHIDSGEGEAFENTFETRGPLRYAGMLTRQFGLNDILNRGYLAFAMMSNQLSLQQLKLYPPDVLIQPAAGQVGVFAFDQTEFAYQRGMEAARAALPLLEALAQPRKPSVWRRVVSQTRDFWKRRVRRNAKREA